MVRHGGGLWGIVRVGMTGALPLEAAGGEDVRVENFEKLRGCPGWLINAGLVPVGLKQLVKMMVGFSEGGAQGEVCLKKKGAKMGVGKKKDCECKVCRVNDKAEKVYKWVVNKCLGMGKEIWEDRCEHWADYCQLHEIKVPRSKARVEVVMSRFGEEDLSGGESYDSEEDSDSGGEAVGHRHDWSVEKSDGKRKREEEVADREAKVRRLCGYTVGQSIGAKRRAIELEAGLSRDIRLLMGPTPVGVGAGEDRIGEVVGGEPQVVGDEDSTEETVEEELVRLGKEVKVEFSRFKTSQQAAIRGMAKRNRRCGHTGEHRICKECKVSKLRAQKDWEKDHRSVVEGLVSAVRYTQRTMRE